MTRRGMGGLALALGLLAGTDGAVHGQAPTAPVVARSGGPASAVRLDRPVPAAVLETPRPVVDANLQPAAFGPLPKSLEAVIRGAAPDVTLDTPQKVGVQPLIATSVTSNTMFQWRRPPDEANGGAFTQGAIAPAGGVQLQMPTGQPTLPMPTPISPPLTPPQGPPLRSIARPGEPEQLAPPGDARPVPAWPISDPAVTDGALTSDCGCGCAGGTCNDCPSRGGFYASGEYLLWWIRGQPLPPLATTNLNPMATNPGVIGQPGTVVVLGDDRVNSGPYSGGRFTLGYWFYDDQALGIELGGFALGGRNRTSAVSSFGNPFLGRPIIDAVTGQETVEVTAATNPVLGVVSVGSVAFTTHTDLWGTELNLRSNLLCGECYHVDLIGGFRVLGLNEDLTVTEHLTGVGPLAGLAFDSVDQFKTSNYFYGGQLGLVSQFRYGNWSLDATGKVALGGTQQTVDISGGSRTNGLNGMIQSFPGQGVLAQPTNDGRHTRDVFSVVPEVGLNLGYRFSDHWRAYAGVNFLYWSNVARPGNEIDRVVNQTQIPPTSLSGGPARPAFAFNGSDFWATGMTLGLEWTF